MVAARPGGSVRPGVAGFKARAREGTMRKQAIWLALVVFAIGFVRALPARAWGDDGHQIVAAIARAYLTPAAKKRVDALLKADLDPLTEPKIGPAATWADRYREANIDGSRLATRQWHFADIELSAPDLHRACFGFPTMAPGVPASRGPAQDCVVNKIQAFAAELENPATPLQERIVALKFLLHFVGDLHQPLHVSDDHDRGGNDKRVSADGFYAGTLHRFWDTEFVERLGPSPARVAAGLVRQISQPDLQVWSVGGPAEWALETFAVGRDHVYGQLPAANGRGSYRLTDAYVEMAIRDVAIQLSKAGVRLAVMLNRALGR